MAFSDLFCCWSVLVEHETVCIIENITHVDYYTVWWCSQGKCSGEPPDPSARLAFCYSTKDFLSFSQMTFHVWAACPKLRLGPSSPSHTTAQYSGTASLSLLESLVTIDGGNPAMKWWDQFVFWGRYKKSLILIYG